MSEPLILDLVFESGGIKGIAFIGALRALANYDYRPGRILGASVGSLFATMLAAGYSPDELHDLIFDSNTEKLRLTQYLQPYPSFNNSQIDASATRRLLDRIDVPYIPDGIEGGIDKWLARILMKHPPFKNFFSFVERGGLLDPEPFVEWLGKLLDAKIAKRSKIPASSMTLAQFHEVTGCLLSVIAADITNPTMLILNHITAPDCPIINAVHMAISEPAYFPPVKWQAEWGLYRGQELTGDLIVDGALLSNFPIELFLSQSQPVINVMGKEKEEASVLGLLLDESLAVPGAPQVDTPQWKLHLNDLPGFTLLTSLVRMVIEARDKRVIETATEYVVRLPALGYDPQAFDLTLEQLQPLINAGYNAMTAHLEKYKLLPGARPISESTMKQVDNTAMHIIHVYGNLIKVDQDIGEVSGTVTGVIKD